MNVVPIEIDDEARAVIVSLAREHIEIIESDADADEGERRYAAALRRAVESLGSVEVSR